MVRAWPKALTGSGCLVGLHLAPSDAFMRSRFFRRHGVSSHDVQSFPVPGLCPSAASARGSAS
jgi:hypothetical protein